jgi:hypothetical protein
MTVRPHRERRKTWVAENLREMALIHWYQTGTIHNTSLNYKPAQGICIVEFEGNLEQGKMSMGKY